MQNKGALPLLSDLIYDELRGNIVSGAWPVGYRLNEKQLARDLHVSRTPLRQALERIYREGLLDYGKNKGYFVRIVTVKDILEIYKIRTSLEVLAFREATKNMREADFATLEKIVEESLAAYHAGDAATMLSKSTAFNEFVYEASAMPRLVMIQKDLQDYLLRFRNISFEGDANERRRLAIEEHSLLLRTMRKRDLETLDVLIEDHLARSRDYILEVVRPEEGQEAEELAQGEASAEEDAKEEGNEDRRAQGARS